MDWTLVLEIALGVCFARSVIVVIKVIVLALLEAIK